MANTFKFGNKNWAVKKDYVLAYNDENNNFKPLPFDFTRASTATYVDSDGLIKTAGNGEPRIDYKDNTDGALLLEPQRRNIVTYSEDFNNASWLKTNLNITKDIEIAPNGLLNASKILQTVGGGSARINTTLTGNETFSLFAKKGDLTDLKLFLGGDYSYFDLENGVVLFTSGSNFVSSNIESFNNDWYRCSITSSYSGGSSIRFQGTNGTNDNSLGYVYAYGAQLEVGSYATSYIPTSGSAVTRVADSSSQTPPDGIIGQTEGVAYVEFDYLNSTGERRFIFQLGTGGDIIYARVESGQTLTSQVLNSGSGFTSSGTAVQSGLNKLAIAYANNDAVIYFNGSQISVTSSITIPSLSNIYIGNNSSLTQTISGIVKDFKLYNTRLSNAELQALTS